MKNIIFMGIISLMPYFVQAQQIEKGKKPLVIEQAIVEVEGKIFLVINKRDTQKLTVKGTMYNVQFDGSIEGINTDKVQISTNKEELIFAPNRVFRITGAIGVRGASSNGLGSNKPGYITSEFNLISGGRVLVSTKGYTESSTEGYDDGGVTQPVMIFTSDAAGAHLNLKVRYGGSAAGNDGYYLAGEATTSSVGTYILVEEL
ncbi:hypothetical protein [Myroides odoratus]|uniref:Uncharacterized protein n=1 Tax=Myroides odoratus TaxID=256 RepID=A0A9Q7EA13_MYROD|nr:hypothetical protein [Myroides odoratus]EHQ44219.1 hypothetical protein Myrod_3413 [Myroides odoratus DSM 2801]EKB05842.1 hypothetical protein HMPREF9716_02680 [Myroides odoratus CIP 103059]QQU01503.1 hypothetical protein I6I88_07115 [Myroides odoratus]WQD56228.1 hypothetical protein U0010_11895 [Myroides odoratus]STZ31534.1 Uncharacterised protein [Myroides odoratus]